MRGQLELQLQRCNWGAMKKRKSSLTPACTVCAITAFVLTVVSPIAIGSGQNEPVQKSTPPTFTENPMPQLSPQAPKLLVGSGVAVWAKEYERLFIAGLDGGLYDPYRPATIQRVQKALQDRGLYAGPMNGILDLPTMKSIYAFQEANNLQRCGVPTPYTRKMLEQGSHTDLTF
jgi:hypothetical protein